MAEILGNGRDAAPHRPRGLRPEVVLLLAALAAFTPGKSSADSGDRIKFDPRVLQDLEAKKRTAQEHIATNNQAIATNNQAIADNNRAIDDSKKRVEEIVRNARGKYGDWRNK